MERHAITANSLSGRVFVELHFSLTVAHPNRATDMMPLFPLNSSG